MSSVHLAAAERSHWWDEHYSKQWHVPEEEVTEVFDRHLAAICMWQSRLPLLSSAHRLSPAGTVAFYQAALSWYLVKDYCGFLSAALCKFVTALFSLEIRFNIVNNENKCVNRSSRVLLIKQNIVYIHTDEWWTHVESIIVLKNRAVDSSHMT